MENQNDKKTHPITVSSKKKLFYIGLAISILNPVFSGLVFGIFLSNEPDFRKESKIITLISIVWGIILTFGAMYLRRYNPGLY